MGAKCLGDRVRKWMGFGAREVEHRSAPQRIREASHSLANETTKIRGVANEARRQTDDLRDFAEAVVADQNRRMEK